jgi:hypothetical protein
MRRSWRSVRPGLCLLFAAGGVFVAGGPFVAGVAFVTGVGCQWGGIRARSWPAWPRSVSSSIPTGGLERS